MSTSTVPTVSTTRIPKKMTTLRTSENYVWSTTNILGKGATGAVYQGVHKSNGELVAVKTFNPISHMRPYEVQMREFDVLKKVKHENIVKLLAIEQEKDTRSKVLVMELCTGGSLFNILDDPENSFGVEESEFLLVLKHMSAGMKHLRDNNIVHRDLKPGNIMKYISEDGKFIFKLTDFGAARELEDGQQFHSLYGTEEYLHPDMYERAVLRKVAGKTFGAAVDLWSIGVTLYHVATGSLPFRPYGGRKNRETMHYITTEKESGVISGVQSTDNGPIEWSRELPSTCQLSVGIKKLVTPLLAGLMECDAQKMWTFEHFFTEATSLLARFPVHIFDINRARLLTFYISLAHQDSKSDSIVITTTNSLQVSDLKEQIHEHTAIQPESQILFVLNDDCCDHGNKSSTRNNIVYPNEDFVIPATNPSKPIYLWKRGSTNCSLAEDTNIPRFPSFPTVISLENDAAIGKQSCSAAHYIKRLVEKTVQCQTIIESAVKQLNELITEMYFKLKNDATHIMNSSTSAVQKVKMVQSRHKSTCNLLDLINPGDPKVQEEKNKLQMLVNSKQESNTTVNKQLVAVQSRIQVEFENVNLKKCFGVSWNEKTTENQSNNSCSSQRANTYIQKMRDSWQQLLRDRNPQRAFSYQDEQFHTLEKVKIQETSQKLLRLYQTECLAAKSLAKHFSEWFIQVQVSIGSSSCLKEELANFFEMLKVHDTTLDEANDTYDQSVQGIMDHLKNKVPSVQEFNESVPSSPAVPQSPRQHLSNMEYDSLSKKNRESQKLKAKQLIDGLNELVLVHEEIKDMMEENKSLMAQLKLTSSSFNEIPNMGEEQQ